MDSIKFNYLYRDGANYKAWGEVVFNNPEQLPLDQIHRRLIASFLTDKLFIANQISIPDQFLFLNGKFTRFDHCYHEFDSVETCDENGTDSLGRSIANFLLEVESVAKQGWRAFDVLDRA